MDREPSTLARDRRGMILIVALPMTALFVGCLCYLASVGEGIVYRERLQDAADATAFESAVLHARGMNVVASLNALSAALSSIDAMLRVLSLLALASVALFGTGQPLLQTALATQLELAPRIDAVASVVGETQRAVMLATPQLATRGASEDNTAFYARQGAAVHSLALSHAALLRRDQVSLRPDPEHAWLFDAQARSAGSPPSAGAPGVLPFDLGASLAECERGQRLGEQEWQALTQLLLRRRELADQSLALAQRLWQMPSKTAFDVWCAPVQALACEGEGEAAATGSCAHVLSGWRKSHPAPVPHSLALVDDAQNGNVLFSTWSIARAADPARRSALESGMRLAASARPVTIHAATYAFAQAEFYFDCSGTWAQCEPDAAWLPRWTARLRRFERPVAALPAARARVVEHAFTRAARALTANAMPADAHALAVDVSELFATREPPIH